MPTPPDASSTFPKSLGDPLIDGVNITPDDDNDLTFLTRALWIGTAGTVVVTMMSGEQITFVGVQGLLPVRVQRVWATGTDADAIVALQ